MSNLHGQTDVVSHSWVRPEDGFSSRLLFQLLQCLVCTDVLPVRVVDGALCKLPTPVVVTLCEHNLAEIMP